MEICFSTVQLLAARATCVHTCKACEVISARVQAYETQGKGWRRRLCNISPSLLAAMHAMQTSKLLAESRYAATCRRMLHGQTAANCNWHSRRCSHSISNYSPETTKAMHQHNGKCLSVGVCVLCMRRRRRLQPAVHRLMPVCLYADCTFLV